MQEITFNSEIIKQIQLMRITDDNFMTIFFDGQNDLMEFSYQNYF